MKLSNLQTHLHRSQGFAPVIMLVIACVVVFGIGLYLYFNQKPTTKPYTNNTSNSTSKPKSSPIVVEDNQILYTRNQNNVFIPVPREISNKKPLPSGVYYIKVTGGAFSKVPYYALKANRTSDTKRQP